MITDKDRFGQARMKLSRARTHIYEVNHHWQQFLESDFCQFDLEKDSDGGQILVVKGVLALPGELLLAVGDAIHNLRCVLDYALSELLGWGDTKLTFPLGETEENLRDALRPETEIVDGKTKKRGRSANVERALPGFTEFLVGTLRPFKGDHGLLWALNKLDVRDKHRLLVPVVIPMGLKGLEVVNEHGFRFSMGQLTFHGGKLNLVQFGGSGARIEKGKTYAEMIFREAGIIEDRPVIPMLIEMYDEVKAAIGKIEAAAAAAGWAEK